MRVAVTSRTIKTRSPVSTPRTLIAKPARVYPIGINHNFTSWTSLTEIKNDYIPRLLEAGVKYARYEFVMADQQPTEGVFSYTGADYNNRVNALRAAGFEIIALLDQYGMPAWAKTSGDGMAHPTPAVYKAWCQNVATYFKGRIRFYEMGNEPNYTFFWPTGVNAVEYTDLMKAGYEGIKLGDPNAKVIAGAFGSVGTTSGNGVATHEFLETMLQNGAANYYDYLSPHTYAQPVSNANFQTVLDNIDQWRGVQTSYGDYKPWIVTEHGWTTYTNGVSEANQASNITSYFNEIMTGERDFIKIICYHNFRESSDAGEPEHNYGLVNNDYSRKPAFQSFIDAKNTFKSTFRELIP